jgi:hypothetical protein
VSQHNRTAKFLRSYNNKLSIFHTRGPKGEKLIFLLFVHGELIFLSDFDGGFVMNSLGKALSEK